MYMYDDVNVLGLLYNHVQLHVHCIHIAHYRCAGKSNNFEANIKKEEKAPPPPRPPWLHFLACACVPIIIYITIGSGTSAR